MGHGLAVTRLGFESDVAVPFYEHEALVDAAGDAVPLNRSPWNWLAGRETGEGRDERPPHCAPRARSADSALADLISAGGLRPGRSERDVAFDLETRTPAEAEGPSFATIVAAGRHSAVPHHRPTDASMRLCDLVKMDFGALVDGDHLDMTRTVVLGLGRSRKRDLHALVAAAQDTGRAHLSPGRQVVDVDAAAREVVASAGYGDGLCTAWGTASACSPRAATARPDRTTRCGGHGRHRRAGHLPARLGRRPHRGHVVVGNALARTADLRAERAARDQLSLATGRPVASVLDGAVLTDLPKGE